MEFTHNDLQIFVGMTLFLVIINFVFPAMGFVDPNINTSDIPEFNVTEGTFDFVQVGTELDVNRPTEGTLRFVDNQSVNQDNRRIFLEGNTNNGVELVLVNNGTISDPAAALFLNEYQNGAFFGRGSTEMENTTAFDQLQQANYTISLRNVQYENVGSADMTITVDWQVEESPGGASSFGSIPLIGGGLEAVARVIGGLISVISWFVNIIWSLILNFIIGSTNLATVIVNVISFGTGLAWWFITTYAAIVSGAPTSYVQIFLVIPSVIWSFEFFKIVIILREQIPVL